jgi:predicted  nucleic acid-binding Zn-ribbon protein
MERQCARCGFTKPDADMSASEACPKCGAIYSKASIAAAQQVQRQRVTERVARERAGPSFIERFLWVIAIIGAGVAIAELSITEFTAQSAPQQAAGAGLALAWAVIPYCLARAVQLATRKQ